MQPRRYYVTVAIQLIVQASGNAASASMLEQGALPSRLCYVEQICLHHFPFLQRLSRKPWLMSKWDRYARNIHSHGILIIFSNQLPGWDERKKRVLKISKCRSRKQLSDDQMSLVCMHPRNTGLLKHTHSTHARILNPSPWTLESRARLKAIKNDVYNHA